MSRVFLKLATITLSLGLLLTPAFSQEEQESQEIDDRQTFGWIEKAHIYPSDLELHAKLDTGADHCSLSADKIEAFERRGETWVRFEIRNKDGVKRTLEMQAQRIAKIKRIAGKSQKRYVVKLGICLGQKYSLVDINLADRTNFSYPLLIGRSFLSAQAMIDPSKTFMTEPKCNFSKEE